MGEVETKIVKTQISQDNSTNTNSPGLPQLSWKSQLRASRQHKKWEAKLDKLRGQKEEGQANLAFWEAKLAKLPVPTDPPPTPTAAYTLTHWEQEDLPLPPSWKEDPRYTAIVDAGASGLYFMPEAPVTNIDVTAPRITVGTASGHPFESSATCEMALPELKDKIALDGHMMPGFKHNLAGISKWCDEDCTVKYTKKDVTIYNPQGVPIVRGWREAPPSKLWRMALVPDGKQDIEDHDGDTVPLSAFSAYDLPSVEALVRFFHAAAGYPVKLLG